MVQFQCLVLIIIGVLFSMVQRYVIPAISPTTPSTFVDIVTIQARIPDTISVSTLVNYQSIAIHRIMTNYDSLFRSLHSRLLCSLSATKYLACFSSLAEMFPD